MVKSKTALVRDVISKLGDGAPTDEILAEVKKRHGLTVGRQIVHNVRSSVRRSRGMTGADRVTADPGQLLVEIPALPPAAERTPAPVEKVVAADPVALVMSLRDLVREWGGETVKRMVDVLEGE